MTLSNCSKGVSLVCTNEYTDADKAAVDRLNARRTEVADYSIVATDHHILLDGTSEAVDGTLPSAVGLDGEGFIVKAINADNAVRVLTVNNEEIDGVDRTSTPLTFLLNQTRHFLSDNVNWWEIS